MTEKEGLEFFRSNGFKEENHVFIGEIGYDFLIFNNSLLIGKNEDNHFILEAMFAFDNIKSLNWNDEKEEIEIDTFK